MDNNQQTAAELLVAGPVAAVAVPTTAASAAVVNFEAKIVGWSLRETTGTAGAVVEIMDGRDANSSPLAEISLAASDVDTKWFGPLGIKAGTGVYLHVISGSVTGAVYLG